MHVVIGGFGRVGRYLAHMLENEGHTVSVVDRDGAVFEEYGGDLKGRKLTGEVFDRSTLIKAGIERADAFAAVTSGDNSNIVSARVARERFKVPTVVARIFDPRRADIYERFGVPTVSSVQWASSRLLAMVLQPGLRVEASYGTGEVLTVSMTVPARLDGHTVGELEADSDFRISALCRGGVAQMPGADTSAVEGDRLMITVHRDHLDELSRLLEHEQEA